MKTKIIILISILLLESLATGTVPHTKGYLFDAFQNKDNIYLAILLVFSNYFLVDFFQALKNYTVIKVSTAYRQIRTKQVVTYNLSPVDNVPQRIQEDIKLSYQARITVYCEYLISGIIVIQLLLINLHQPILLISSLIYAGLSVMIAISFNPRLTEAEKTVQKTEATFRYNLTNIIGLNGLSEALNANLRAAAIRLNYQLFTKLQLAFLNVLPLVVLTPAYMLGTITLGDLMMHQATFSLLVLNSAILIQYYTVLIQGKASESRVKELGDRITPQGYAEK